MRNKELDAALRRLAEAGSVPDVPPNFEANVWRAIRERRGPASEPSILDSLWAILFEPAGVFSVAMVTLVIAIGMGSFESPGAFPGSASEMSVFAANAPALPSTLVSQAR